jgi:hypothetical protein
MKSLIFDGPSKPVNELIVLNYECLIGSPLPSDYREFIIRTNGGVPTSENNAFKISNYFGYEVECEEIIIGLFYPAEDEEYPSIQLESNYRVFKGRVPAETVPIASDLFGNQLLLGIGHAVVSRVYFWDHEFECQGLMNRPIDPYRNVRKLCDSFECFVNLLVAS